MILTVLVPAAAVSCQVVEPVPVESVLKTSLAGLLPVACLPSRGLHVPAVHAVELAAVDAVEFLSVSALFPLVVESLLVTWHLILELRHPTMTHQSSDNVIVYASMKERHLKNSPLRGHEKTGNE